MNVLRFDCRLERPNGFVLERSFDTSSRVFAIRGPSGIGKTTVAHLLAGLLKPDRGMIAFGDHVWTDTRSTKYLPPERRNLGMVFQDIRLFPHLTVKQNLSFGAPADARSLNVPEMMKTLGLNELLQRKPQQLSGGEQQRVAIGRALMRLPRLLILDEPLSGVDAQRKDRILDYFKDYLHRHDVQAVFITHDQKDLEKLADEVWDLAVA